MGVQVSGKKWPHFMVGITVIAFAWKKKENENLCQDKKSCGQDLIKPHSENNLEAK
jgi:hypothetical protein